MSRSDGASNAGNRGCGQSAPLTLILSPRSEGRGEAEEWLNFNRIPRVYRKTAP
jgi:hypothetical protein